MAVSDFRKHKLNYVFDTYFDISKDGCIEDDDFKLAVENIAKLRGYEKGSKIYQDISTGFFQVWESLRAVADADGDNSVSREEWIAIWSDDQGKNQEWKKLYMQLMFKIQDADGDGSIDAEEYVSVAGTFGVDKAEAEKAFKKISNNGKLVVDLNHYSKLWNEYFTSDNGDALGNCIFGKVSFP